MLKKKKKKRETLCLSIVRGEGRTSDNVEREKGNKKGGWREVLKREKQKEN